MTQREAEDLETLEESMANTLSTISEIAGKGEDDGTLVQTLLNLIGEYATDSNTWHLTTSGGNK